MWRIGHYTLHKKKWIEHTERQNTVDIQIRAGIKIDYIENINSMELSKITEGKALRHVKPK